MSGTWNRREMLGAAAAALATPARALAAPRDIEIRIAPVSPHTFRLTASAGTEVPDDGCLVQASWGAPIARLRANSKAQTIKAGGAAIQFAPDPIAFTIPGVQTLKLDADSGVLSF